MKSLTKIYSLDEACEEIKVGKYFRYISNHMAPLERWDGIFLEEYEFCYDHLMVKVFLLKNLNSPKIITGYCNEFIIRDETIKRENNGLWLLK